MEQRMTGNDTRPEIEPSSDEEWKNRVKAEDAALDQQFDRQGAPAADSKAAEAKSATATQERPNATTHDRPKSEAPAEFPEATFEALLGMLSTQAMVALGVIPNPATRKPERNLPIARYFIDLIGVIDKTTSGNLAPDEAAALEQTLHSLRMAYVELSKETS
jgi:hypothetical protein